MASDNQATFRSNQFPISSQPAIAKQPLAPILYFFMASNNKTIIKQPLTPVLHYFTASNNQPTFRPNQFPTSSQPAIAKQPSWRSSAAKTATLISPQMTTIKSPSRSCCEALNVS